MARRKRKISTGNSKQAIEKMKYEIASELGVNMGPNTSSKANGTVGGEMTKRLVHMAEQELNGSHQSRQKK